MALLPGKSKKNLLVFFGLCLIMAATAMSNNGCSREARYQVLTFFFTGVPPLDGESTSTELSGAKKTGDAGQAARAAVTAGPDEAMLTEEKEPEISVLYKHAPFEENSCESCHDVDRGNRLFNEPRKLCFRCHESFSGLYTWIHGPVAAGACKACHEPHQSRHESLLIAKSQEICLKCHLKEDILFAPYHMEIGEKICFECHDPHGSTDRRLLKQE